MGKRSDTILAPDDKRTVVNKKFFTNENKAKRFATFIGKRLHHQRYDINLKQWVITYYRDTRRNRELFGFKEHIPNFTPKNEYWD